MRLPIYSGKTTRTTASKQTNKENEFALFSVRVSRRLRYPIPRQHARAHRPRSQASRRTYGNCRFIGCFVFVKDPNHERAKQNVIYFGEELQRYKITGERGDTAVLSESSAKPVSERDLHHQSSGFQSYEKLCRGEVRNLVRSHLFWCSCSSYYSRAWQKICMMTS